MTWRPRLVVASAALGALVAVAVWVAGPSLALRAGPVSAFRAIPAQAAQSPSGAPPVQQAIHLQSPAPAKSVSQHPPSHVAPANSTVTASCTNSDGLFMFTGFSRVGGTAPGTVTMAWSATDNCPPYHGTIQSVHELTNGGSQTRMFTISALSGTITENFDCAATPHVFSINYTISLQDSAKNLQTGYTTVPVC